MVSSGVILSEDDLLFDVKSLLCCRPDGDGFVDLKNVSSPELTTAYSWPVVLVPPSTLAGGDDGYFFLTVGGVRRSKTL